MTDALASKLEAISRFYRATGSDSDKRIIVVEGEDGKQVLTIDDLDIAAQALRSHAAQVAVSEAETGADPIAVMDAFDRKYMPAIQSGLSHIEARGLALAEVDAFYASLQAARIPAVPEGLPQPFAIVRTDPNQAFVSLGFRDEVTCSRFLKMLAAAPQEPK